eukprot:scaffold122216_cov35-Tisochrysis_lutea.AAC.4
MANTRFPACARALTFERQWKLDAPKPWMSSRGGSSSFPASMYETVYSRGSAAPTTESERSLFRRKSHVFWRGTPSRWTPRASDHESCSGGRAAEPLTATLGSRAQSAAVAAQSSMPIRSESKEGKGVRVLLLC